jgi:hypothetical protein
MRHAWMCHDAGFSSIAALAAVAECHMTAVCELLRYTKLLALQSGYH